LASSLSTVHLQVFKVSLHQPERLATGQLPSAFQCAAARAATVTESDYCPTPLIC
jgi:hypothetical protein